MSERTGKRPRKLKLEPRLSFEADNETPLQEDLRNYYYWKLMGGVPKLKPSAKLRLTSTNNEDAAPNTSNQDDSGTLAMGFEPVDAPVLMELLLRHNIDKPQTTQEHLFELALTNLSIIAPKQPRHSSPKRTEPEVIITPVPEVTAPTSPEPPVNFSIRIEVESGDDDDWTYEDDAENTVETQKVDAQPQNDTENPSRRRTILDADTLYLGTSNFKHGLLESSQESGVEMEPLSEENPVTLENEKVLSVEQIKEEPVEEFCIKQEIVEDSVDQSTIVNLTESLGITIKEEPLEEVSFREEHAVSSCTFQENVSFFMNESVIYEPTHQIDVIQQSPQNAVENLTAAETMTWRKKLKLACPRYYDISLKKAVESIGTVRRYVCQLCSETFRPHRRGNRATDECLEDFRCHLNCLHSDDSLILRAIGETSSIVAVRVLETDKEYMKFITEAWSDVYWSKRYLKFIIRSLTKTSKKSKWKILAYKCYECRYTYEHLSNFLEHLRCNHKREIKITTEMVRSVFVNVAACYRERKSREDFPLAPEESATTSYKCLECKTDFKADITAFHNHKKAKHTCLGCFKKLFCYQLHGHVGFCDKFLFNYYPKTCPCGAVSLNAAAAAEHQTQCIDSLGLVSFQCRVCTHRAPSMPLLKEHQDLCHTVRSDGFIFTVGNFDYVTWTVARAVVHSKTKRPKTLDSPCVLAPIARAKREAPVRKDPAKKAAPVRKSRAKPVKEVDKPLIVMGTVSGKAILRMYRKKPVAKTEHKCPVCFERYSTLAALEAHELVKHQVRSDYVMLQAVSCCKACNALYTGPVSCHDCPKKPNMKPCPLCDQKFHSTLLVAYHLKRQRQFTCKVCKEVLPYECLKAKHELVCGDELKEPREDEGDVMEKLKSSFGAEELASTEDMDEMDEKNCIPVMSISISADPMKEHCYAATYKRISDTVEESEPKEAPDEAENLNEDQKSEEARVTENAANGLSDDDDDILTIIETASSDVEKNNITNSSDFKSCTEKQMTSNDVKLCNKTVKKEPVIDVATSSSDEVDKSSRREKHNVGLKYTESIKEIRDRLKKRIRERDVKFIVSSNERSLLKPLPVTEYVKDVTTDAKKEKRGDIKPIETPKPDNDNRELEKNGAATEIMIKPEPLDLDDEFVITKTENIDAEVSIEDFIANNSELEMIGIEPEVVLLESKPRPTNRVYRCANCGFEGYHFIYVRHKKVCHRTRRIKHERRIPSNKEERRIPANFLLCCRSFNCSACGSDHNTLQSYHSHSCSRERTCPHCDTQFTRKEFTQFTCHIQSHIRLQFVAVYSLGNTVDTEFRKLFSCVECKAHVERDQVFNHWERHRYSDSIFGTVTVKLEPSEPGTDVPQDALPPKIVEAMIRTLQSREKNKEKLCIMCVKYFGRDHDLKRHVIEHLIKDAFLKRRTYSALRCQICSADHKTLNYYKRHMRDHGHLPLYHCHICDKAFSDSSNFAKHKKVHNVRVKICDHCSKKFHSKAMLIKHIEMHSTVTPKGCEHCGMTFLYASDLRRHVRNRHSDEKGPYKCRICTFKGPTIKEKWDHEWQSHGVRNQEADCPDCGVQFRKYNDLKRHMRLLHDKLIDKKTFFTLNKETRSRETVQPAKKAAAAPDRFFKCNSTNYNFLTYGNALQDGSRNEVK